MKTFLLVLFFVPSVAFCEDFAVVYNYSAVEVQLVTSVGYFYVQPSGFCYVPRSSSIDVFSKLADEWVLRDSRLGFEKPCVFLAGETAHIGGEFGDWHEQKFSLGWQLGLALAAAMLLFWIVGLLGRPTVED